MVSDAERKSDRSKWWDIHDKDEYICPDCHRTRDEHGRRWEVHHIDGVKSNCVALCQACHKVRHGAKRRCIELEAWKSEFLKLGAD